MNLFSLLARGTAHAPSPVTIAAEKTRTHWRSSLLTDQLRAWEHINEEEVGALNGLATLLTLAGMAWAHDHPGEPDALAVRVIRGGLSAAINCAKIGCMITAEHARALSSAAAHADNVIAAASVAAIVKASVEMNRISESQP